MSIWWRGARDAYMMGLALFIWVVWGGKLPQLPSRAHAAGPYGEMVTDAAARYDLDPILLAALVQAESGWNPSAVSPVGAMGLGQLMPGTADYLGVSNPFDPEQNLDGAARYLASMLARYDGDVRLALAAYNAGPGRVDACRCVPDNGETPGYVTDVLAAADGYRLPAIALPYRNSYRLINNGLHGDGPWPGRDYAAACGTTLYAPISGRVETGFDDYTGPYGSRNSYLLITGDGVQVMMMHGEYVATGQVRQGDLVGFEASIGNSTECHTHLAIRMRGELVDPITFFEGR